MMPADLNKRLSELEQEDATYVVKLFDGKRVVEAKHFNPCSYGHALVWATAKYREEYNWAIEVKTLAVNNKPPRKVMRADGEVR